MEKPPEDSKNQRENKRKRSSGEIAAEGLAMEAAKEKPAYEFLCEPDKYGLINPFIRKFDFEDHAHLDDSFYYESVSDDEDWEEPKMTTVHDTLKRFLKQVRESRGYDVDCVPPLWFGSPFLPRELSEEENKEFYDEVTNVAQFAVGKVNEETSGRGSTYVLQNVEKVVETCNFMMLLTFNAKEVVAGANAGADAAVKTLQAMVYLPLHGADPILEEWRFKPVPDATGACSQCIMWQHK